MSFSLKALGHILPCLFAASGGRSNPWRSLACRRITTISASVSTWPSPRASLSTFPSSHKDISPWTEAHHPPDVILMDYICKSPVSNKVILTGPGCT